MTFACPEWTVDEVIQAAVKYGYDGVEIRTDSKQKHGVELDMSVESRIDVKRKIDDAGIEIPCIATSLKFAISDDAMRNKNIEMLPAYAELAESLGCPKLRIFAGLDASTGVDEKIKIAIGSLSTAVEMLEKYDVALSLETHDSLYLGKWIGQVVKTVASSKLRANWDIMHPFLHGESIAESYGYLKDVMNHTHFHDGVRGDESEESIYLTQIGGGSVPHKEVMQLLKDGGHDVYLSGEWWPRYCGEPEFALRQFIDRLKSYESELA